MTIATHNLHSHNIRALLSSIIDAGVQPPESLAAIAEAFETLKSAPTKNAADPVAAIIDRIAAGDKLDAAELDAAIAEAASAEHASQFRAQLTQRAERAAVRAVADYLDNGGADEIIDSLREQFDSARDGLAAARAAGINEDTDAEAFLLRADAKAKAAWRQIDEHIVTLNRVASVVSHFGPAGDWAMIDLPQVDHRGLFASSRAVFCTGGLDVYRAAQAFRGANGAHRQSPWAKVASSLKLLSVAEVRERVRAFAEAAWDNAISSTGRGRLTADGFVAEPYVNPYAVASV